MNNPFLLGPRQLNQSWRDLRASLTADLSDTDHLNLVAKFWSMAPLSSPFTDWDNPQSWPTAWELINDNDFDSSLVALAMEYTLLLAADKRWTEARLELRLITFVDRSRQDLILSADKNFMLNYSHGKVIELSDVARDFVINQRYGYSNRIHSLIKSNLAQVGAW